MIGNVIVVIILIVNIHTRFKFFCYDFVSFQELTSRLSSIFGRNQQTNNPIDSPLINTIDLYSRISLVILIAVISGLIVEALAI